MQTHWMMGLWGGGLIGLSATLLLAFNGRIAGISGIVNGAMTFTEAARWQGWFLVGLLAGGGLYEYVLVAQPLPPAPVAPWSMVIGGVLVGVGTRMGNGCTSGHGVCGLGRLSVRSLVAVLTFMTTAALTVFVTRHLW